MMGIFGDKDKVKVIEKNGRKFLTKNGRRAGSLPGEAEKQAPLSKTPIPGTPFSRVNVPLSLPLQLKGDKFEAPESVASETILSSVDLAAQRFRILTDPDIARGAEYAKNRIKLPKGVMLSLPEVDFDYKDHPTAEAYPIGIVAQIKVEGSSNTITIYKTQEDDPEDYRNQFEGMEYFKKNSTGLAPYEYHMGPAPTSFQLHDSRYDGDLETALSRTEPLRHSGFETLGFVSDPESLLPDAIRGAIKIAQSVPKPSKFSPPAR